MQNISTINIVWTDRETYSNVGCL